MRITVIKTTKRKTEKRTFKRVDSARRWAGRARNLTVIVTG